jgi:hypothetical protein
MGSDAWLVLHAQGSWPSPQGHLEALSLPSGPGSNGLSPDPNSQPFHDLE